MINPVSSSSEVSQAVPTQSPAQAKPAPPHKPPASSPAPQDTVALSSKAKAQVSGDVDHDGDSH